MGDKTGVAVFSIGPAVSAAMAVKLIERNRSCLFQDRHTNEDKLEGIPKRMEIKGSGVFS